MTGWVDELVASSAYREWAPNRPWQAAQEERHVFFMHYEADPDQVRAVVPSQLDLELYGGTVYIGVAALEVRKARLRNLRLPSWWRSFPEVDLMAYVSYEGRRGVFFLSIESHRRLFSLGTRWGMGLPYLYSGLVIAHETGSPPRHHVTSGPRPNEGGPMASLDLTYEARPELAGRDPHSPILPLLSQYSAFVVNLAGRVCELDEVHADWQPVEAEVEVRSNTLGEALGIDLPPEPTLAHYAATRRVITWLPKVVEPGRPGLAPTEPRDRDGARAR